MRHSTLVSAAVDTLGKEALSPWDWLDTLGIRSGSDLANWTYSDSEDELRENVTCILGDRVRNEPERFNNLLKMWKYCRERADAWVGLDLKRSRLGTPFLDAGQRKDVKVEAPPHPAQKRSLPDRNLDLGSKNEHEKRLAEALLSTIRVAKEFRDQSGLIQSLKRIGAPPAECRGAIKMALNAKLGAPRSVIEAARFTQGYVNFVRQKMKHSPTYPLTGKDSYIAVAAYLTSVRGRGETVPAAAKHALGVFAAALGVNLALDHPLVSQAAAIPASKPVRQAPLLPVEMALAMEARALEENALEGRRVFAACIALMTNATLRFCDVQRVDSIDQNESAVFGTTWRSKTKVSGQNQWAAPKAGVAGSEGWHLPLFTYRTDYKKKYGRDPHFILPQLDTRWNIIEDVPMSAASARRALNTWASALEVKGGGKLTLHSPRTFFPTCSAQLGHPLSWRRKLGRWSTNSQMPERYDRSSCSGELALRKRVLAALSKGWKPVDSFHVPLTQGKPTDRPQSAAPTQPTDVSGITQESWSDGSSLFSD